MYLLYWIKIICNFCSTMFKSDERASFWSKFYKFYRIFSILYTIYTNLMIVRIQFVTISRWILHSCESLEVRKMPGRVHSGELPKQTNTSFPRVPLNPVGLIARKLRRIEVINGNTYRGNKYELVLHTDPNSVQVPIRCCVLYDWIWSTNLILDNLILDTCTKCKTQITCINESNNNNNNLVWWDCHHIAPTKCESISKRKQCRALSVYQTIFKPFPAVLITK